MSGLTDLTPSLSPNQNALPPASPPPPPSPAHPTPTVDEMMQSDRNLPPSPPPTADMEFECASHCASPSPSPAPGPEPMQAPPTQPICLMLENEAEMTSAMEPMDEYELYSKKCISAFDMEQEQVLFVEADYKESLPSMQYRSMMVTNVSFTHYEIMDPTTALPRSCEMLCDGMAQCECIDGMPRMNTMYYEMDMDKAMVNADEEMHIMLFDDAIGNVEDIRFNLMDKKQAETETIEDLVAMEGPSTELVIFGIFVLFIFICAKVLPVVAKLIKMERSKSMSKKKKKKTKTFRKFNINAFANNPAMACTLRTREE